MRNAKLPSWRDFGLFLFYSTLLAGLFAAVYLPANYYGSLQAEPHRLYYWWELYVPFVPEMIFVYMSLNLFTGLTIFYLNRQEIHGIAAVFAATILISGVIFVLYPTELGFLRVGESTSYARLFAKLYSLDRPHNLFPSLHISIATVACLALLKRVGPKMKIFVNIWFLAIVSSVVLTHQHHLVDILGGWLVGYFAMRAIFTKVVRE